MTNVKFEEAVAVHAARLGVAPHYGRVRRRMLSERLGGPPALARRGDHSPAGVRRASARASWVSLQVLLRARLTSRAVPLLVLTPRRGAAVPTALLRRQRLTALCATGPLSLGGAGRSRRTPHPPYGDRRTADGQLVRDPDDAPAVDGACRRILARAARPGRVPWAAVAAELCRLGWRRRRGRTWRGAAGGDLTAVTTYAGYVRHAWRTGRPAEVALSRVAVMPRPGVDPLPFLPAAHPGRGRGTPWLVVLAGGVAEAAQAPVRRETGDGG